MQVVHGGEADTQVVFVMSEVNLLVDSDVSVAYIYACKMYGWCIWDGCAQRG